MEENKEESMCHKCYYYLTCQESCEAFIKYNPSLQPAKEKVISSRDKRLIPESNASTMLPQSQEVQRDYTQEELINILKLIRSKVGSYSKNHRTSIKLIPKEKVVSIIDLEINKLGEIK